MTRWVSLVLGASLCVPPVAPVAADERPKKLSAKERKELQAKWDKVTAAGIKAYQAGKVVEATKAFEEALPLARRLFPKAEFPKGHSDLGASLVYLGFLYQAQGKLAEATPLLEEAPDMLKRLHKRDHLDVANGLNNLASLNQAQGKLAEAAPLFQGALDMLKRLFQGDHPEVATCESNLGLLYKNQGKLAEAAPLLEDALHMRQRLFKGDHLHVANSLINLGLLYQAQGKLAEAAHRFKGALGVGKRLAVAYAKQRSEGEALTFAAVQPRTRDAYLSVARLRAKGGKHDPASAYPAVWATKGMVARVFEQRQARARAAATDPALAKQLDALADARRRRAELLLAPATRDVGTRKQRQADLKALDEAIAKRNEALVKASPAVARLGKLDKATAADLRRHCPRTTPWWITFATPSSSGMTASPPARSRSGPRVTWRSW
jgi:tetratricopeptide (TPR) repeat protein